VAQLPETVILADGDSKYTLNRIKKSGIKAYDSDADLVAEVDILLSIVPPRDATATAIRVLEACRDVEAVKRRTERKLDAPEDRLVYIDCNAVSPKTTRNMASFFVPREEPPQTPRPQDAPQSPSVERQRFSLTRVLSFRTPTMEANPSAPPLRPILCHFLDGGIIGAPPKRNDTSNDGTSSSSAPAWTLPSLVMSGPEIHRHLPHALRETLNITVLDHTIGTASTLKSCFASITKGMTAIATISFATAQQSNVLPQLTTHLNHYAPKLLEAAEKSMATMPPKAYRWVEEMRQIGSTFATEGGLDSGDEVFKGVADLYRFVAEDTVLGEERVESRKRGRTAEDVATAIGEGVKAKRTKAGAAAGGEEALKLAWRGSWT
jgi:hypothetical protein